MRIKVTPETIRDYGLDKLSGNSSVELTVWAQELEAKGYDMYITIPDAQGGDTEAPSERNVFDHFSQDLPDPDGDSHDQESVNLLADTEAVEKSYRADAQCRYFQDTLITGEVAWICVTHGAPSKYVVDETSHQPCAAIDPFCSKKDN